MADSSRTARYRRREERAMERERSQMEALEVAREVERLRLECKELQGSLNAGSQLTRESTGSGLAQHLMESTPDLGSPGRLRKQEDIRMRVAREDNPDTQEVVDRNSTRIGAIREEYTGAQGLELDRKGARIGWSVGENLDAHESAFGRRGSDRIGEVKEEYGQEDRVRTAGRLYAELEEQERRNVLLDRRERELRLREDALIKRERILDPSLSLGFDLGVRPVGLENRGNYGACDSRGTFPKFSVFSGEDPKPKQEVTFEEWMYELDCVLGENLYTESMVAQAVRRSLRGPAKRIIMTLGSLASLKDIIHRLDGVFGNVASGESILQEFYTTKQGQDETVAAWGLRLEEILQKAIEKGHVDRMSRNRMLHTKFWKSLRSEKLKNATRVKFETIKIFEELRKAVRAEEYEMSLSSTVQVKSTVTLDSQTDTKLDLVLRKIETLERDIVELKRDRPTTLEPNTRESKSDRGYSHKPGMATKYSKAGHLNY